MTPNSVNVEINNYEIQPSLTYRLDLENKRISGNVDGSDSVFQAIVKILNTDKYANEIYDWNYGQELLKLIGKDFSYIEVKLPQIIEEALLQDDRIQGIDDMEITKINSDTVNVSFAVITIFSKINYSMEVKVL